MFAKEPPKERVLTLSATNGKFKIPPGDPNYKVDAEFELGDNGEARWACIRTCMGAERISNTASSIPPAKRETLLRVPRYNWHWQLWYNLAKPIVLPKGTKIECTAHFDNSPNNPDNADPTKEVTWGDQSWDEMMVGFFNLVFDANMPVKEIFRDAGDGGAQLVPPELRLGSSGAASRHSPASSHTDYCTRRDYARASRTAVVHISKSFQSIA